MAIHAHGPECPHCHHGARTPAPTLPRAGDLVAYRSPSWGPCVGEVLRADDARPGYVLVQDLAPIGAREWWPVAELTPVRR